MFLVAFLEVFKWLHSLAAFLHQPLYIDTKHRVQQRPNSPPLGAQQTCCAMSLNSSQAKCKGYLVWQQDSKGACASTCYGISSAITAGRVDLEEHAASYNPKPEHADFLFSLSCLGSSVYQNSDSSQKVSW